MTTTPKPGWAHTPVASEIRDRLGVPVRFDTDVNAAALGEHRWGPGRDVSSLCYLTVGTGTATVGTLRAQHLGVQVKKT